MLLAGGSAAQADQRRIVDPREVMALEEGVWDAVIQSHSRASSGKPAVANGVQVNEFRSGGKWMLNRMSVNGGAYEGTGIWGHDPKTGRYVGSWADSSSNAIRTDDGVWNPDSNTMTWTAQVERTAGQRVRMRATSTFQGNIRIYRSFILSDGGEMPLSTVIFTRRPDAAVR
jgi:hypothetical protein